jgi:hypothetical protein
MTEPLESTPGMIDSQKSSGVRWRSVAVPKEHGGWGFLLDPILLGLLVAPSPAGLFLVLLDLAAFLARTPLKIVWKDTQRGRRYARTAAALKALFVYAVLAVFSLVAALILGGPLPLAPLFLVLPLAAAVLYFDLLSTSRKLLPELIAPLSLSAVLASMALADGWAWPAMLALWAIPLMRSLPAVVYVRARLRLEREKEAGVGTAVMLHVLALLISLALVWADLLPWLAAAAMAILLGRAVYGLSPYRREMSVKSLGWSEIVFGLLTVILSALGYWLQ